MFKVLLFGLAIALCFSCATTDKTDEFGIEILLNPKFPVTLGLSDSGPEQAHLLDNDGNKYITYWEVDEERYETFGDSVKSCRELLRDNRLFLSAYTIHQYKIDEIKPGLYKPFVLCLRNEGFNHVGQEAHFPEYYELSFARSHNTKRNYMPVGVKYFLRKTNTPYIEAFRDTLLCDEKVLASGHGVKEIYSYDYRQVSIEKYVEEFKKCLSISGYEVEKASR